MRLCLRRSPRANAAAAAVPVYPLLLSIRRAQSVPPRRRVHIVLCIASAAAAARAVCIGQGGGKPIYIGWRRPSLARGGTPVVYLRLCFLVHRQADPDPADRRAQRALARRHTDPAQTSSSMRLFQSNTRVRRM